jgi:hypothetical protein
MWFFGRDWPEDISLKFQGDFQLEDVTGNETLVFIILPRVHGNSGPLFVEHNHMVAQFVRVPDAVRWLYPRTCHNGMR